VGFEPTFYFLASNMAEKGSISERVERIAASVAGGVGIELVHCQIVGSKRNPVVRLVIEKPGGVTLDDCAQVSREVEAILDRDDFIPTAYVLEVSSPGIERELYSLADFEKFVGKDARIKTDRSIGGQRNFSGAIVGVANGEIEFEDRTTGRVSIPFVSVAKANLIVDITEDLRKR
jgi:ribosome maturation factor RimP